MSEAANGDGLGLNLSAREQEVLSKVMLCLKSSPEVDYPKLAQHLGMANHRSASNAWLAIRKKLWKDGEGPSTPAGGKVTKTPKSTATKKRVVKAEDDDEDEAKPETPSKKAKTKATPNPKAAHKPKATPKKNQKEEKEEAQDEVDDVDMEEIPAAAEKEVAEKLKKANLKKEEAGTDAEEDEDDTEAQLALG